MLTEGGSMEPAGPRKAREMDRGKRKAREKKGREMELQQRLSC